MESLGRTPFEFQADLVDRCLRAIQKRERLLVQSPTGTGKTLVLQLAVGVLAEEQPRNFPRVLVVVPSRALLVQHAVDANWLRGRFGLALHGLYPELPPRVVDVLLHSFGVFLVTPVTLARRLNALGADALAKFDCAFFDEIDTYLTRDELVERVDTWEALEICQRVHIPIVGFTGTHLSSQQLEAWRSRGFAAVDAEIPSDWMPDTTVEFVGVHDKEVVLRDREIRDKLRDAYRALGEEDLSWSEIKRLARGGDPNALAILRLSGERLQLFESPGARHEKPRRVIELSKKRGATLVLSRFRLSAERMRDSLISAGVEAWELDGSMPRHQINQGTQRFRSLGSSSRAALIITRELGGRGLDFPSAARVTAVSPRSNYQAVAQELARIRSRHNSPKTATVLYYRDTEEQAKARRLAEHLRRDHYRDHRLFTIRGLPDPYSLEPFESRNLRNEESIQA